MSIETLTGTILRQLAGVNKWQQDFFQHLLILYLSLRGRYNFSGFSRCTGLQHCQSRESKALQHHFNRSLTAVSLAKAAHLLAGKKENRTPFSMANIKTQYFNEHLIDRVFEVFANVPNIQKNNPAIQNLIFLGKIAA